LSSTEVRLSTPTSKVSSKREERRNSVRDLFVGDLLAVDFQNSKAAWVRQRELQAGDQAPCLLWRSARGPRHAGARSAAVSVPRDGLAAGERVAAMVGIERVWLGGARKKSCNIRRAVYRIDAVPPIRT
jgi:hypothetical protein